MGSWLLDFFYPPTCPHCGGPVKGQGLWCPACLDQVLRIRSLPVDQLHYLDRMYVLGDYQGGVKTLLHDIKFNGKEGRAAWGQAFLTALDDQHLLKHIDGVVPIPINEEKKRIRGYNQVDLLFKDWVNHKESHRFWQWLDILEKGSSPGDMWHMSRLERKAHTSHLFSIKAGQEKLVAGKHLLLVDDIYTTGATLEAAASLLKEASATCVEGLALASNRV